jgi:hypothetical protein
MAFSHEQFSQPPSPFRQGTPSAALSPAGRESEAASEARDLREILGVN